MTISIAPSRDPAVLPIGRKGTAGKTANTQNTPKATEPRTSFGTGARAILVNKVLNSNNNQRLKTPPLGLQQWHSPIESDRMKFPEHEKPID